MRTSILCLLTLSGALSLDAAPLTWVEYRYHIGAANQGFPTFDTGQLPQTSIIMPLTVSTDNSLPNISATAEAYGSAAPGVLHGFAYSDIVDPSPQLGVFAIADVSLFFGDRLYFNSETQAPGTPVQFQLTSVLHSIVGQTGVPCGSSGQEAFSQDGTSIPGTFNQHSSCDPGPAETTKTSSVMLSSTVGGFRDIVGEMDLGTSVETLVTGGRNTAIADASNTGIFQVEILTPGVTLSSASGATYSAVPEPAGASMILIGLLVLACRRIKGRDTYR